MNTFKFDFDVDKNKYILKINDKTFELTREEAVNIHNTMNWRGNINSYSELKDSEIK